MAEVDLSAYSEPIARVYEQVSDRVIVKIARYFRPDIKQPSESVEWQMLKLTQLGKFTDETARLITKGVEGVDVEGALYKAVIDTLNKIDPTLIDAALKGYASATSAPAMTDTLKRILRQYSEQAVKQLNLVNTVMLDSAKKSYLTVVNNAVQGIQQSGMAASAAATVQRELNTATGAVVLGTQSRQEALFTAIRNMARADVTGFVDRGGHNWTAEAYVNMDIRTTAGRVAIEAQKERTAAYGVDTFQITSKNAARELCAPYQGWICSWGGRRGTVKDFSGAEYTLRSIYDTSYGKPAGIFGINCGHRPATFIPGYTIPRYNEGTNADNDAQLTLAQKHRDIERDIRRIKREAAALSAAGAPDEKLAEYAANIKIKTKALKTWAKDNERTYRADRVRVEVYDMELERRIKEG